MIGISLTVNMITEVNMSSAEEAILNHYGSSEKMLDSFIEKGVNHIELRNFSKDSPYSIAALAKRIWQKGFSISIHGKLVEGRSFEQYYKEFIDVILLSQAYQNRFIVTVHALSGKRYDLGEYSEKTHNVLAEWCNQIGDKYPVSLALELNRNKDIIDPGTKCDGLLEMIKGLPEPRVGLCWDFGHYYYNNKVIERLAEQLPPKDFLERVIHTHIHSLDNENKTHHPFKEEIDFPLDVYLREIYKHNYKGLYNLELSFNRIQKNELVNSLEYSINKLKKAVKSYK